MGDISRSMAFLFILVILIGTVIGSILPEFGNVLANHLDQGAHKYNIHFLVIGVLGIVLALYFRFEVHR